MVQIIKIYHIIQCDQFYNPTGIIYNFVILTQKKQYLNLKHNIIRDLKYVKFLYVYSFTNKIINKKMSSLEQNKEQQIKVRPKFSIITKVVKQILSWRFLYLVLFTLGGAILQWIGAVIYLNWVQFYLPLGLILVAILIKLLLGRKASLKLKQIYSIQLSFFIAYCLSGINVYLTVTINSSLIDYEEITSSDIGITNASNICSCIIFFVFAFMCSLIAHKKTTSVLEYWSILITCTIDVFFQIYNTIVTIQNFNVTIDGFDSISQSSLFDYFTDSTYTLDQYQYIKQLISQYNILVESTKDLSLVLLASSIATNILIMDLIGRPRQQIQKQQKRKQSQSFIINQAHDLHQTLLLIKNQNNSNLTRLTKKQNNQVIISKQNRKTGNIPCLSEQLKDMQRRLSVAQNQKHIESFTLKQTQQICQFKTKKGQSLINNKIKNKIDIDFDIELQTIGNEDFERKQSKYSVN